MKHQWSFWSDKKRHDHSMRDRWRKLPRLLKLMWEAGPRAFTTIAVFSVLLGVVPLVALLVLRALVDSAVGVIEGTTTLTSALLWLGVFLAATLADPVITMVQLWLGDDLALRLKEGAQERLLTKAGRLSLEMFDRPEIFDLLHTSEFGLDKQLLMGMRNILSLPASVITVVGLLFFLGTAHWLLPLVLVAGMIPLHVSESRIFRRIVLLKRKHAASERYMAHLDDLIVGREAASELRLFGTGPYLRDRRMELNTMMKDDRLRLALERSKSALSGNLWEQLTYGVVITGVVALIALGRLSVGYFAAYLTAVERFTRGVDGVFAAFRSTDKTLGHMWDVFDYLDLPEEWVQPQGAIGADPNGTTEVASIASATDAPDALLDGEITVRFEEVIFSYPGAERPVLDGVTLTMQPGKTIALVGENGAGKTTLSKLLLGLYMPTNGRITVNGQDLAEIDPVLWRRHGAAVFQDYVRYEMTARENIGYGDLPRLDDMSAIRNAASKSGADAVVETLPKGYDTVLGKAWDDEGRDLSTGQWQKLVIARAYFREASVLILDEPTSGLDARAEVEVYRRFRDMSVGKSVLLISHRLGSARLADQIVFLENGRIVEEGTHEELVGLGGRYARMYSVQAGWYN